MSKIIVMCERTHSM